MGNDAAIVQAARTSYGKGTKTPSEDQQLINRLMRNDHTTPFEMCEIKLHMKLPIFIARQMIRHRTASINEYSCRYSEVPDAIYNPEEDRISMQSGRDKQGSGEQALGRAKLGFINVTSNVQSISQQAVAFGEKYGIARELNRINMTVAHYTEWYWKIDLHNLFRFLRLRLDHHAQWEIRQYAEVIAAIVSEWVPMAWGAFVQYQLHAIKFSLKEQEFLYNSKHSLFVIACEMLNNNIPKPDDFSTGEWREFHSKIKLMANRE
jgi:thymidylate synthase (FAD)